MLLYWLKQKDIAVKRKTKLSFAKWKICFKFALYIHMSFFCLILHNDVQTLWSSKHSKPSELRCKKDFAALLVIDIFLPTIYSQWILIDYYWYLHYLITIYMPHFKVPAIFFTTLKWRTLHTIKYCFFIWQSQRKNQV